MSRLSASSCSSAISSQMPFDPAQGCKQVLSGLLVVVVEPLHELAKNRDAHGDMEPVEDMLAPVRSFPRASGLLPPVGD
ncbi:msr6318 [Mesorhizobium japonicum MAFF 303099]|uniref:Msr6318 protein n=1 Tax=Mesorhizobium japonicum (strain LMG 29417 / CECT 9101 / MAFF 303099) TaxID=266835 RepID=Q989R3_RHILO|nr:msr6318 [Mesorhizobium japonicum MAFF 303099]